MVKGDYMIALNELINRKEEFKQNYIDRGLKINLNSILDAENDRKTIQLKAESLRAETNKLCASIAVLKRQNKDLSNTMQKIEANESDIKKYQKQLVALGNKIDSKLKKLPNITKFNNKEDISIKTDNKTKNIREFLTFLDNNFIKDQSNKSIKNYVKSLKDRLFQETELGIITYCKNGIVILFQNYKEDYVENLILDYLKTHSSILKQKATNSLKKSSACEYVSVLNKTPLNIEIKAEYFTRLYKIKYRNKQLDTTKFLYEIDIIFNKNLLK